MIKDDIISIAREAGCLGPGLGGDPDGLWEPSGEENVTELMFRFAELLEAKVRKECAAICRKEAAETDRHLSIVIEALEDCAYLIEKRGHK